MATGTVAVRARPVAMVHPDHDGTAIAQAVIVGARLEQAAARHGLKVIAAGLWAARDRIFAGAMTAIGVRRRCRCPNST
jgi:hypothetical protein